MREQFKRCIFQKKEKSETHTELRRKGKPVGDPVLL